jgi:hypothetical protein
MTTPLDPAIRNRNRWMLIALFALFFGAMFIAGALRFSGWRPSAMKNHGELLQPPGDLRAVVPTLTDGSVYRWNPGERTWRIVTVARDCAGAGQAACAQLLGQLDTVRQLSGKDIDRVHLLWIGALPAGGPRPAALHAVQPSAALQRGLPRSRDPAGNVVYLLDPNGFVVLRYAPGFDPAGLRTDLSRLLKIN